jgi:hypothetical protein
MLKEDVFGKDALKPLKSKRLKALVQFRKITVAATKNAQKKGKKVVDDD